MPQERRELVQAWQEYFFQGAGGVADVFQKAVSVRNVGVKSQLQGVKEMMRGAVHSFSY